jgi:hypothetical protein
MTTIATDKSSMVYEKNGNSLQLILDNSKTDHFGFKVNSHKFKPAVKRTPAKNKLI